MTKNVTVTDENGTYVGSTYPRRARGLVKNGRAFFVDDCTIRLSGKAEPSDDKSNQSEVKQMNYIYFNPREWSFEQTQYNTQFHNNNGFYQSGSNRRSNIERCFINDFDNGLIECLMLGGWDDPYVRVTSMSFTLLPDTENCFVFWLNGGENDKNSEICQLQISFSDIPDDCYIYKLNRNYIRPLLHKQGWELYSIPFMAPSSVQTSVEARFSFVAGNAPMALKPAKEPSFYKDWKDEPDEFAKWRPQRHNLVFEDGWPAINMYGGDKYSTEILRRKMNQRVPEQHSQMSGYRRGNSERMKNQTGRRAELAEQLSELSERQAELASRQVELSELQDDLQMRYNEIQSSYSVSEDETAQFDEGFNEIIEWDAISSALSALDTQFACASEIISNGDIPIYAVEGAEGILDGIDNQLDSIENMCDNIEDVLDELEELLNEIEDKAEASED